MRKTLGKIANLAYRVTLATALDLLILIVLVIGYRENFSDLARDKKVHEMYNQIWIQTGQNQDRLPLYIEDNPQINAYNDGTKIVVYTGLLDSARSWDEIAMVLGHEVAHGNLWHLKMLQEWGVSSDYEISVLEGNADKMGAVYALKAGYDVCKGREVFKYWKETNGNYLGGNHPNYSYRYDELNFNCE